MMLKELYIIHESYLLLVLCLICFPSRSIHSFIQFTNLMLCNAFKTSSSLLVLAVGVSRFPLVELGVLVSVAELTDMGELAGGTGDLHRAGSNLTWTSVSKPWSPVARSTCI